MPDQLPVASESPRDTHELTEATISALVAAIDRQQAALAASTPEQAAARARYYRKVGENYLRLSAAKRKQGHGDCSRELAAAERQAAAAINGATVIPFPGRTRTSACSRERRERRHTARSTSSGDSGDSDSELPDGWRWTQPPEWLPGHGDVEIQAAPVHAGHPADDWIEGTF